MKPLELLKKYFSIFLIVILIFSSFPNINYASDSVINDNKGNIENIDVQKGLDDENNVGQNENVNTEKSEKKEDIKNNQETNIQKQNNTVTPEKSKELTNRDVTTTSNNITSQTTGDNGEEDSVGENDESNTEDDTRLTNEDIKLLVSKSINDTVDYYKNNLPKYTESNKGSHSDYWVYSALWSAGIKNLKTDITWPENNNPWLEFTYWSQGINKANSTSNEDAGAIIGSSLLGLNPYKFGSRDVVADLIAKQQENGSFFTAWGNPWAMIALDLVDAQYDREKLIEHILSTHNESGLFGGSFGDADATGWALLALAPYKATNKEVSNAIEYTIEKIRLNYIENNAILGQMFAPNANSTSAIIMGIAANGVDLTSEDWTNEHGNIIENFIKDYQQENGSFWWQKNAAGAVGIATEQALLALATVQAGQSTFQLMKQQLSIPEKQLSNNAELSKLVIDNGIGEVLIDDGKSQYEYIVDAAVESIQITPTVSHTGATIKINHDPVPNNQAYTFVLKEGTNKISVNVTAEDGVTTNTITIIINRNFVYSASRVKEFLPAPGQFVNKAPWGLNPEKTLYFPGTSQGVSLGAFGGYIIFEFDEPIKNDSNNPYGVDFIVYGNAFSGNEEPGGVQVMTEDDGTWYDIAGSEHYEDETITDYEVTYSNPHESFEEAAKNVPWTDNNGKAGFVNANNFHKQPYYPNSENYNTDTLTVSEDKLTFSGVKLNNRKVKFGYVDAFPDASKSGEATNPYTSEQRGAPIDISWAVDEEGQPVHLDEIKYVKVYTGMLENLGALGEISTEVTGIARVKKSEQIGETKDLNKILINDVEVELTTNKYVYDVVVKADSINVTAEGSAENIYINNEKTNSSVPSKLMTIDENEVRTVRIIAQSGKNNPKIYYLNITKGNEHEEPIVDKTALEALVNNTKDVDLSNKTEKSKNDYIAKLEEAIEILNNEKATQSEVDNAKNALEKAITNLKERAPPVKVNVRVETHEKTLVPMTELEVEPFDLMEYINNNNGGKPVIHDEARAIHAIIRALETIDGFNPKDDNQFGLGSGGNYIQKIDKDGEFTAGPLSGWMYFVDNTFAPVGVGDFKIKDGESIVLYYVPNYIDNTYSWFENEYYETTIGKSLVLTLKGNQSTEGAHLLINEEPYKIDGQPVLVDENGEISVVFDKPGTYHISANRFNSSGERNIVRPYAIVSVVEEKDDEEPIQYDTVAPEITVSGVENNQKVTQSKILFTVQAIDKVDGEITPTVEVNGNIISANGSGEFIAELKIGSNTITITAEDRAGNVSEKTFKITYELSKEEKDAKQAIEKIVSYLLKNGVTSEWEAVGLSKANVDVPASYTEHFNQKIQNEIISGLKNGRFTITDAERLTLAALAIGKDPRNINGTNLIELIYNSPNREMWDGSIEDTMTFQGNNGLAFALIALDAANFKVPKNAKWTREKLVSKLLETQREDGAWNLNDAYPSPSVDITAMVLTALAPYNDKENVKQSIERALNYLEENQIDEGGFDGGAFVGGVTSEATSQVIIALTANGIDPTDERFTKANHLIDHLLMHQNKDGGFSHTFGDTESNNMATEQALQALVAYSLFLQEKGSLYKFELEETDDPNGDQNGNENGKEETPKPIDSEEPEEEKDKKEDKSGGKTDEDDDNLPYLTDDVTNLVTIDDKTTDSNKKLPNTATNNYNVILIGLLFIIVGIAFITYKRRKISH